MKSPDPWIECAYFTVEQPIGEFYVAKLDWEDLREIAWVDIRRVEEEERGEVDTYLGIQRQLSRHRVQEIGQYVNTIDASFPNSIILSIDSHTRAALTHAGAGQHQDSGEVSESLVGNIEIDEKRHVLRIRRGKDVAKVIDGQHRIAGLKQYEDGRKPFEVIVTVFVDMDIASQALVFSTINKAQTKVNKSLVYDLFAYAKSRSPQKTAHVIAVLLDERPNSPFFGRIKRLGRANDEFETITQATFVESLLRYVSSNPAKDADDLKRGRELERVSGLVARRLVLRERFRKEKDAEIARIVWDYFDAVRDRWSAWDDVRRGAILNRSTGFIALMRFFGDVYRSSPGTDLESLRAHFRAVFSSVELSDDDFTPEKYIPGSSGQSQLLADLRKGSRIGG